MERHQIYKTLYLKNVMKASHNNSIIFLNFYKHRKPLQWKKLKEFLTTSGSVFRCWLLGACSHGARLLSSLRLVLNKIQYQTLKTRLITVLVALGHRVIPVSTQALIQSAIINNRFYAGLILVLLVAPLSACIHALPGMKEEIHVEGWLYENYHDLFLVLGPYFFALCIVFTGFLWVPPKVQRIKFSKKHISIQLTRAWSVPMGLIIGKIVWLICCTNNEDFDVVFHPIFFLGGVVSYPVVRLLEYLVWRQEHVMNALIDSLQGLYKLDIDPKEREKMAAPLWNDLRQFNSKY
jgi:hypothetical protein